MTKVTLFTDDEGVPRGFDVRYHSGFDRAGRDIVCSAVSILTINTINAIERYTEDMPETAADPTKTRIRCIFRKTPGEGSILLLNTFSLGVRTISDEYRRNVRVEVRRYE